MSYYSQFGEDQWIVEHLSLPEQGFFVDVGAGDGISCSNTLHFEEKGWLGICIDADYRCYANLIETRHTPVLAAIRNQVGMTDFSLAVPRSGWSGVEPLRGQPHIEVKMPCVPLSVVLAGMSVPVIDLLSIDVEGLEREVLESFSLDTFQPKVIIVEYLARDTHDHTDDLVSFFTEEPYQLVHTTDANLIWKRL
jgi:FkbM family methyltransferase